MDFKPDHLSRKIKIKNYTLPLMVIGLIIIQFFTSERAWEILLAAFGTAQLLSIAWAFSLRQGLTIGREMRQGWAQVGDRFSEQFIVTNRGFFPALAVSVIDHSNLPGYQSNVAWPVGGKFDRLWFMDSMCYKRGLYNVGPTEIFTGDPFGVFEITIRSDQTDEILVTPPIVPLRQIDLSSGDWQGDGGTRSKQFDRTVTAASVREYAPGDSLFSVHWLTSARRDDLFVRTYDQKPSSDWWIILDMERYVQIGKGLDSTDEYAAILAASVADRGLREDRAVGLIGEGSKTFWLPPRTGAGQRGEIMHTLAVMNRGGVPLKSLLAKAQRFMQRKSSAIIITPSINPEWLAPLSSLKQRGITTTVLFLDPEEFGSPEPGAPILNQLNTWGIHNYLIGKDIYTWPRIQEIIPSQFKATPEMAALAQKGTN